MGLVGGESLGRIMERGSVGEESTITNNNGLTLATRTWTPASSIRGIVFLCHGFGEHLGWYGGLATALMERGLLVVGHDHQGHGKSEGPRAYAVSMEHVEQDILRHCGFLKSRYPAVPIFIYGHSMGGMLAVSLVIRNPAFFKGMVLEGPLILPDPAQVTPVRLLLGKMACSLIPEMQLEKIRVEQVTSDKETQEKLSRDKLRWMGGTKLGVAVAFVRCLEAIHTQMSSVTLPFLVLHGGNDSLCMLAGSHLLINQSSSENKRLKVFPTASHHLIIEERKVREAAVGETVSWIVEQLDGGWQHREGGSAETRND